MNLDEMRIEEKIIRLEALLAKAHADLDYSFSVRWGEDKEEAIRNMYVTLESSKLMFMGGRIFDVDYERREETIKKFNESLNAHLCKFPEFYLKLEDEIPKR